MQLVSSIKTTTFHRALLRALVGISTDIRAIRYASLETLHSIGLAVEKEHKHAPATEWAALGALIKALQSSQHELLADGKYLRARFASLLSSSASDSPLSTSDRVLLINSLYPKANELDVADDRMLLSSLRDIDDNAVLSNGIALLEHYLSQSFMTVDGMHVIETILESFTESRMASVPKVAAAALVSSLKSKLSAVDGDRTISVRGLAVVRAKEVFSALSSKDQVRMSEHMMTNIQEFTNHDPIMREDEYSRRHFVCPRMMFMSHNTIHI